MMAMMMADDDKINDNDPSQSRFSMWAILLVQLDQYGIAHAPFALGWPYLSKHRRGDCKVMVHGVDNPDDDDVDDKYKGREDDDKIDIPNFYCSRKDDDKRDGSNEMRER